MPDGRSGSSRKYVVDRYSFELRQYDSKVGRFLSVDPYRVGYSPYIGMANDPVNMVDPTGGAPFDWFKGSNGEVKWFDTSAEGFSDADGVSWSNIGTEILSFDGQNLNYQVQFGNMFDGFHIESFDFGAVSGRPLDGGGFDYSQSRQVEPNVGPIPEGLYWVYPSKAQSITPIGRYAGPLGKVFMQMGVEKLGTAWPGGTYAWGENRLEIYPKQNGYYLNPGLSREIVIRGNFFIHGGSSPGSAGCIDCHSNNGAFFNTLSKYSGGGKVYLQVDY